MHTAKHISETQKHVDVIRLGVSLNDSVKPRMQKKDRSCVLNHFNLTSRREDILQPDLKKGGSQLW